VTLALWLIVKGFRASTLASLPGTDGNHTSRKHRGAART
jgi:hypothetical protein